jgi:uncharacterized protein YbgA (DUF1722 family)
MKEINSISFSLYDILKYLIDRWMFYLVGALLGALVALGISIANTTYSATVLLSLNRSFDLLTPTSDDTEQQSVPFDFIAWRATEKQLIDLMQEVAKNKNAKNALMHDIASSVSAQWLSQHVAPVKFLSTNEGKEVLGINSMIIGRSRPSEESQSLKFLERAIAESTRISALSVTQTAKTKEDAIARADAAADILVNAFALLRYRALIHSREISLSSADLKLSSEMSRLKLKLTALETRRNKLLKLNQEFPSQSIQSVAITDEALSKYLPIPTQLVAINIEIDQVTERLVAITQAQEKNALIKTFSNEAQKILSQQFIAHNVIEQLLNAEANMREKISKSDRNSLMTMDSLRAQLLLSQSINNSQIKVSPAFISQAPMPLKLSIKGAWLGLALALLLSILFSIFQNAKTAARLERD